MLRDPACSTFRKILVASVFGVGVFLIPHGVQSATSNSATIQWAANQESDLAGYRVYHGTTAGNYSSSQDAGTTTTYQYDNLESNKTHYFSVTAYDSSGNESNPSPEVNTFIHAAVPPTLTSPKPNTTLEGATTTFTWTPNETAVSAYWLEVGSAADVDELYDSGSIAASVLSRSVSGLPTDGRAVFVRFGWLVNGKWETSRVEFTAAGGSISSFPLTITKSGDGSGTITSNPIGLNCGSTCMASFSTDSLVTLSANAASDSNFSGWSGGGCSGTSSCTLTLSSSASVSANFVSSPPASSSLSVTLAGGGSGTVSSSPAGVTCSNGACSGTFPQGSSVTLTATPNTGNMFSGWGGACSGTSSCVVALSTSSASVSAAFATSQTVSHLLSLSLTGDGKGSVTSSPSGLTCSGGTCTASFPQGTTVTLTPATQTGNVFQGWNGVCSGTSNCVVTLTSAQIVTAVFNLENLNPPPMPDLPFLVNFQTPFSQVPTNFKKDDGSVFDATRGYGWNKLLKGTEQNSTADQTLDTFVSTENRNPGTWEITIDNGIYYVSMVLGDPKKPQGPHWVEAEGLQLAKQVKTSKGEYLTIVDYPVEVQDGSLSIKIGNSGQGQTVLNYLIINSAPNILQSTQNLAASFGTPLITSVTISGGVTKVNPTMLAQQDNGKKEQEKLAEAQKIQEQEAAAVAQARVKKQKEHEMETLNEIKEKIVSKRNSGGTVSLRSLFGK